MLPPLEEPYIVEWFQRAGQLTSSLLACIAQSQFGLLQLGRRHPLRRRSRFRCQTSESCIEVNVDKMRKWAGVRTSMSSGFSEMRKCGREFNIAEISRTKVRSLWNVSTDFSTTISKWYFVDFTAPSHKPPRCGEQGAMKFHLISIEVRELHNSLLWGSLRNTCQSSVT